MPGIKEERTWVKSDMQKTDPRIAGIATGGVERRQAVLSGKRIVTAGCRNGHLIRQRAGVMIVLIKGRDPALGTVSAIS